MLSLIFFENSRFQHARRRHYVLGKGGDNGGKVFPRQDGKLAKVVRLKV